MYRFDKDGSQWKERGAGTVKFLKHKESGKIRLVMRQSKTLKICANHLGTDRDYFLMMDLCLCYSHCLILLLVCSYVGDECSGTRWE